MSLTAFSHGPSGVSVEPAAQKKSRVVWFLLLPGLVYLGLFFITPLISLVITAFKEAPPGAFIGEYVNAFRWENYAEVLSLYGEHSVRSFLYAAAATLIALAIGYPLAYFIGVRLRPYPLWQSLALVLVIAPFFISFLLRTVAWKQLLADEGFIRLAGDALSDRTVAAHAILSVDGFGPKRMARISFDSGEIKSFQLSKSPIDII
jgi:spermidine/putrescine transport system permease protein